MTTSFTRVAYLHLHQPRHQQQYSCAAMHWKMLQHPIVQRGNNSVWALHYKWLFTHNTLVIWSCGDTRILISAAFTHNDFDHEGSDSAFCHIYVQACQLLSLSVFINFTLYDTGYSFYRFGMTLMNNTNSPVNWRNATATLAKQLLFIFSATSEQNISMLPSSCVSTS